MKVPMTLPTLIILTLTLALTPIPAVEAVVQDPLIPTATVEESSQVDPADIDLLARLLYSECRGEPEEGWLMVAQCVVDRLETGIWGDTLHEVITAKGQFAKPAQEINEPAVFEELVAVAEAVLAGERFDEEYVILYFQRSRSSKDWYAGYLGRIGNHAYYGERRPV